MTFWHSAAHAGTEIRSREQGGLTPAHLGRRKVQNTHAEGEGLDARSPEASGKLGAGSGSSVIWEPAWEWVEEADLPKHLGIPRLRRGHDSFEQVPFDFVPTKNR